MLGDVYDTRVTKRKLLAYREIRNRRDRIPPQRNPVMNPPARLRIRLRLIHPDHEKTGLAAGFPMIGVTGFEPATSSSRTKTATNPNTDNKALTEDGAAVCTPVCTSEPKTAHADPLKELAGALQKLSPTDRARLVSMLARESG